MTEENLTPRRNSPNLEYDYSEEIKKPKNEDITVNNFIGETKVQVTKFEKNENGTSIETMDIPFSFDSHDKIEKYQTIKKYFKEKQQPLAVKKTRFNQFIKFLLKNFFSKKELYKFTKFIPAQNDLDYLESFEIAKANKKATKEKLIEICTKLVNISVYK